MKTTPIDAMTFNMGNKPIQELIEEKAVMLHEKLLRISGEQYWKTYEKQAKKPKDAEWIYTESNRNKDTIRD